jgi:hypothetical protein
MWLVWCALVRGKRVAAGNRHMCQFRISHFPNLQREERKCVQMHWAIGVTTGVLHVMVCNYFQRACTRTPHHCTRVSPRTPSACRAGDLWPPPAVLYDQRARLSNGGPPTRPHFPAACSSRQGSCPTSLLCWLCSCSAWHNNKHTCPHDTRAHTSPQTAGMSFQIGTPPQPVSVLFATRSGKLAIGTPTTSGKNHVICEV